MGTWQKNSLLLSLFPLGFEERKVPFPWASKQHIPLRGFQTQGLGQTLPLIDVFIHRERRNKLLSRVDRLGVCPCMGGRPGDILVYGICSAFKRLDNYQSVGGTRNPRTFLCHWATRLTCWVHLLVSPLIQLLPLPLLRSSFAVPLSKEIRPQNEPHLLQPLLRATPHRGTDPKPRQ